MKAVIHNFFNYLNIWRNNMPMQMIELEEVQMPKIDDDQLTEIVTKSKAQYGNTADEYVEGCQ